MQVRITKKGVHVPGLKNEDGRRMDEPLKVGTVIDLGGDEIPTQLVNKCEPVVEDADVEGEGNDGGDGDEDKTAVTNPAGGGKGKKAEVK